MATPNIGNITPNTGRFLKEDDTAINLADLVAGGTAGTAIGVNTTTPVLNFVKFTDATNEYYVECLPGFAFSAAKCRVNRRTIATDKWTWSSSAVPGDGSYGTFAFIATDASVCAALTYNYGVAL